MPCLIAKSTHARSSRPADGQRDFGPWKVEALVRGNRPAHLDAAAHGAFVLFDHLQPDPPVGQKDVSALADRLRQALPRHGERRRVADDRLRRDRDLGADVERDMAALDVAEAKLRPGQVAQDADLLAALAWRRARAISTFSAWSASVPCEKLKRKTSAPASDQLAHLLEGARRRADRADDLRAADLGRWLAHDLGRTSVSLVRAVCVGSGPSWRIRRFFHRRLERLDLGQTPAEPGDHEAGGHGDQRQEPLPGAELQPARRSLVSAGSRMPGRGGRPEMAIIASM